MRKENDMDELKGLFGQHGWICPKCGRVYSPYTYMCMYCGGGDTSYTARVSNTLNSVFNAMAECAKEIKNKENGTE